MNADPSPSIAHRLVADFLLPDGDTVIQTRDGSVASIVVTTRAGWRVESLPEIGTTATGPGYRLFVADTALTDVRDPEAGFAVLPDGQAFHLNDPAQLRAFHRQVTPRPSPLETAYLIASYVEPQPVPRFLVTSEPSPEMTADGPGRTRVTLYTYTWQSSADETGRRVYEHWDILLGDDIEWTRTDVDTFTKLTDEG